MPNQLQINFNMSFLDLPCEYLTVDALDVLGSNRVNITGACVRSFVCMCVGVCVCVCACALFLSFFLSFLSLRVLTASSGAGVKRSNEGSAPLGSSRLDDVG